MHAGDTLYLNIAESGGSVSSRLLEAGFRVTYGLASAVDAAKQETKPSATTQPDGLVEENANAQTSEAAVSGESDSA